MAAIATVVVSASVFRRWGQIGRDPHLRESGRGRDRGSTGGALA